MFCGFCGRKLEEEAVFCPYCGTKQKTADSPEKDTDHIKKEAGDGMMLCPACGTENRQEDMFCASCGVSLDGSMPGLGADAAARSAAGGGKSGGRKWKTAAATAGVLLVVAAVFVFRRFPPFSAVFCREQFPIFLLCEGS